LARCGRWSDAATALLIAKFYELHLGERVAPEISTGDIYRGIIPFVLLQVMALVLVFFSPGLAIWLPRAIGW
jgi:TRAP-type mannitol/chloroaromatic compound transport system permease large subunit